jgi:N-acetylneuraminic acid mutarotase
MSHDIATLEQKLRRLQQDLKWLADANHADRLIPIIHRPGWTTVHEYQLVEEMVDALQYQLIGLKRGQENLFNITSGMGSGWSSVPAIPNQHQYLSAATTAVYPPPPIEPGGFVDGTVIVVTARLYVIGGSGQSNDVQAYHPATDNWTTAAVLPTARFNLAAAVGSDHRIYAIGGRTNPGGLLSNVVEAFSPTAFHWRAVPGAWSGGLSAMPTARERSAAATGPDGRIYVVGGSNGSVNIPAALSTLEIYDAASDSWTSGASLPTPRDGAAAVTGADGRIYALGGFDGQKSLSSVEAYDVATNSWAPIAAMTTPRSELGAVTAPDGRIYVVGGNNGSGEVLSSVEIYHPTTQSWGPGPSLLSPRASFAAAIGPDGRLYAIGGYNGIFVLDSVEALSL